MVDRAPEIKPHRDLAAMCDQVIHDIDEVLADQEKMTQKQPKAKK